MQAKRLRKVDLETMSLHYCSFFSLPCFPAGMQEDLAAGQWTGNRRSKKTWVLSSITSIPGTAALMQYIS